MLMGEKVDHNSSALNNTLLTLQAQLTLLLSFITTSTDKDGHKDGDSSRSHKDGKKKRGDGDDKRDDDGRNEKERRQH